MVALARRLAHYGSPRRRRQAAFGSLALVITLILLGLPAFADMAREPALPCGALAEAAAEAPLHELITAPIVDTYIDQYDGTKNVDHSAEPKLRLRQAENGEADILLQFDLGGIPADAIIQSVELEMHAVYARPALGPENVPGVALYRLFRPWCADADWARYCQSGQWCLPGAEGVEGDCAADPDRGPEHINAQMSVEDGLFKLKVHSASYDTLAQWVQAWVSGDYPNEGLLLELTQPVKDVQHVDFAGSGYFGFPEASAPLLKVVFTEPIPTGDIGGVIWLDKNANNVRDTELGEKPLGGIKVELLESDCETVLYEMNTNACGEYMFPRIDADNYCLRFTPPEGYLFSPGSGVNPATGIEGPITLAPGEKRLSEDVGMFAEGMVLYFPIFTNRGTYWP